MSATWQIALLLTAAYLLGTIPFGLIVSRLKGVDIRKHGSGNYGATNVGRVLGRNWGALVLMLDAAKGAVATLAASAWLDRAGGAPTDGAHRDFVLLGAGLLCVLGNIAPFYLRFKGGKAVAASLGVILGIYPYLTLPGLVAFSAWAIVVRVSGYVSLGSIVAAGMLPVTFVAFAGFCAWPLRDHYPLLCLTAAMAALVLIRHRANIGRLLAGTEPKIGSSITQRPS